MTEYAGIEVSSTWVDGRLAELEIIRAPQVVGFSKALLEMADPLHLTWTNDLITVRGVWAADGEPAELRYRPVTTDQDGRVIVCERVT